MCRNIHQPANLDEFSNVQTPLALLVLGHERLGTVELFSQLCLRNARFDPGLLQAIQKLRIKSGRKGLQGTKRLMFGP